MGRLFFYTYVPAARVNHPAHRLSLQLSPYRQRVPYLYVYALLSSSPCGEVFSPEHFIDY